MKSSDADESVCSAVDITCRWALNCCWEWSRSWSCGRCSGHGWESAPDETAPRNWFVSFFQLDFCWVAIGQTAEAKPTSKEMGAFDQGGWVVHTVLCLVLWIQIGILVIMEKPFYFGGWDVEIWAVLWSRVLWIEGYWSHSKL